MSLSLAFAFRTASVGAEDSEPLPTEFQIFAPGVNESTKGEATFDAAAARSVMAAYQRHGVDRMIDLEHLSIDRKAKSYDPDARGWFQLELRADGSLWAVNVRWTSDGARRLKEKTQRYISPAFFHDSKGRIVRLLNVAITAQPATHGAEALIAASETPLETRSMDPETVAKALDMLEAGDLEGLKEMFKASIAAAAGASAGAPPPEPPPAPASEPPAPEENADPQSDDASEDEDEDKAMMAAASELMTLSAADSAPQMIEQIKLWKDAYVERETERDRIAGERAVLETKERRTLVAELVKLGAETPATAWSDDKGSVPVKRLTDEPIGDLRARVKALSAARGSKPKTPRSPTPPSTDNPYNLTEQQLRICAETKCDPAVFAKLRSN